MVQRVVTTKHAARESVVMRNHESGQLTPKSQCKVAVALQRIITAFINH